MKKSILFILAMWICIAPITIIAEGTFRKKDKEEESERNKGVAGAINRTSNLIVGTICLAAAGIIGAEKAWPSMRDAYAESKGLVWFMNKDTWTNLFYAKNDANSQTDKKIGVEYIKALGWTGGTLYLSLYGIKQVLMSVGLIKR